MKMNILNKAMAAGNTPAYKRKAFQDVADVAASVGSKHIEARAEYMAGIEKAKAAQREAAQEKKDTKTNIAKKIREMVRPFRQKTPDDWYLYVDINLNVHYDYITIDSRAKEELIEYTTYINDMIENNKIKVDEEYGVQPHIIR